MFFDPEMDKKMVQDGFIVLPLLEKNEIQEFHELYKKWHPEDPTAFYKSYFDPRMEYKLEVENKIIGARQLHLNPDEWKTSFHHRKVY
jgi:hypothetical protein